MLFSKAISWTWFRLYFLAIMLLIAFFFVFLSVMFHNSLNLFLFAAFWHAQLPSKKCLTLLLLAKFYVDVEYALPVTIHFLMTFFTELDFSFLETPSKKLVPVWTCTIIITMLHPASLWSRTILRCLQRRRMAQSPFTYSSTLAIFSFQFFLFMCFKFKVK